MTLTPKADLIRSNVRPRLEKPGCRHRVIREVFEARLSPVTSRFANASLVTTDDDKFACGVAVTETPKHFAQLRATAMRIHDGGMLPLSLAAGIDNVPANVT